MAKISINLDSLKPKRTFTRHKVAVGHNVYRLGPPFGDASNGYPYRKWMITWGLVDPQTGRMRPFASSLTSEKKCPIFEYVDLLTKKAESIKATLKAKGASDEDIKEKLKNINKVIGNVRPKTVYVYNGINKAGEVGLLEIKSTAQKKLKELMMEYIRDYNQDPTSLNGADDDSGVWFDFVRTGEGFDTEYDVKKLQTKARAANGQMSFVDDRTPLSDNIVQNYESLAYDLSTVYEVKTYDALKDVLLANLRNILTECPEAGVPGFSADEAETASEIGGTEDAPPARQAASTTKPAATGKKPVNLKLGDDDDAPAVHTATKATAPLVDDDDDIFKMADDILNS